MPRLTREPDAIEHDVACPECGSAMRLRQDSYFTGRFYGCTHFPFCRGTRRANADGSLREAPMTEGIKEARIAAGRAFDSLWQSNAMSRGEAYTWMQKAMGLTHRQAHIGLFRIEQCQRLIELVKEHGRHG